MIRYAEIVVVLFNRCGCGCHDVRSWLLFAQSLKGTLSRAVKAGGQLHSPDTLHGAYLNLTPLSPDSKQPYWKFSCHTFERALSRAPSGVTWLLLTESKYKRCQAIARGLRWQMPPICSHVPALKSSPCPNPMAAVWISS